MRCIATYGTTLVNLTRSKTLALTAEANLVKYGPDAMRIANVIATSKPVHWFTQFNSFWAAQVLGTRPCLDRPQLYG